MHILIIVKLRSLLRERPYLTRFHNHANAFYSTEDQVDLYPMHACISEAITYSSRLAHVPYSPVLVMIATHKPSDGLQGHVPPAPPLILLPAPSSPPSCGRLLPACGAPGLGVNCCATGFIGLPPADAPPPRPPPPPRPRAPPRGKPVCTPPLCGCVAPPCPAKPGPPNCCWGAFGSAC